MNFEHNKGEEWEEDEWLSVNLKDGEWLSYRINIRPFLEQQSLIIEVSAQGKCGELVVYVDGKKIGGIVSPSDWQTLSVGRGVLLDADVHQIKLKANKGQVSIKWFHIIA